MSKQNRTDRHLRKKLLSAVIAVVVCFGAHAADESPPDENEIQAKKMSEEAQRVREDPELLAEARRLSDQAKESARHDAKELMANPLSTVKNGSQEAVPGAPAVQEPPDIFSKTPPKPVSGDVWYVLLSSTLGESELRNIFEYYQNRDRIVFVIKGVKDPDKIMEETLWWQKLAHLSDEYNAPVQMNPNIFRKYKVSAIPVVIHEKDGELVSRAEGVWDTAVLEGKKGDIGVRGETKDIAELDMIDVMMKQVNDEADPKKMKEKYFDNYWKTQEFVNFPDVVKPLRKVVDASVEIPEDIKTPDGKVVIEKGIVNPLKLVTFNMKLIFFDASSDWQRKIAAREYQSVPQGIKPILITTGVDKDDGWKTFRETQEYGTDATGKPARVYFIQHGMAERYAIERIPSVVTAENYSFIVNEIPKSSLLTGEDKNEVKDEQKEKQ